jgi:hypothetical protein
LNYFIKQQTANRLNITQKQTAMSTSAGKRSKRDTMDANPSIPTNALTEVAEAFNLDNEIKTLQDQLKTLRVQVKEKKSSIALVRKAKALYYQTQKKDPVILSYVRQQNDITDDEVIPWRLVRKVTDQKFEALREEEKVALLNLVS